MLVASSDDVTLVDLVGAYQGDFGRTLVIVSMNWRIALWEYIHGSCI